MPVVPKPVPPIPKRPMPPIPAKPVPRIIMKPTVDLTPPVKRGPGRPPKIKDPNAPEPVKRPRGRPRKSPPGAPVLTPNDPRRNPTFEEAFPREQGPDQFIFPQGEGWKLLTDDEHYYTIILDRGSFSNLWGMLRAETKRHWGSTLSDQGANIRALKAFAQAFKENES